MINGLNSSESGQGLEEYALILSLIVIGVVSLLSGVGTRIVALYQSLLDNWP